MSPPILIREGNYSMDYPLMGKAAFTFQDYLHSAQGINPNKSPLLHCVKGNLIYSQWGSHAALALPEYT